MYKVKVYGAGSIGNHLSHASRSLGWSVDMCDIDPAALARTRNDIYPSRYGAWDDAIRQFDNKDAPRGEYDLIVVGTPPDHHIDLALDALTENPEAILVEKPFCTPDLDGAQRLVDEAAARGVTVFTGYDHVVGQASARMADLIGGGTLGDIQTLDVEFREYWGGIFNAHPWLDGPSDTYLGYWRRGGGASGEHSHAMNLWQNFAHAAGAGRVVEVGATMDFVSDGTVDYDRLCAFDVKTENGLVGRVVQDVVTKPPRKWARIQGDAGYAEWHCGYKPGVDAVASGDEGGERDRQEFEKTRPDDFIAELHHIEAALESGAPSPISMQRGLETMLVVAAAHMSVTERRVVSIDYAKGIGPDALS